MRNAVQRKRSRTPASSIMNTMSGARNVAATHRNIQVLLQKQRQEASNCAADRSRLWSRRHVLRAVALTSEAGARASMCASLRARNNMSPNGRVRLRRKMAGYRRRQREKTSPVCAAKAALVAQVAAESAKAQARRAQAAADKAGEEREQHRGRGRAGSVGISRGRIIIQPDRMNAATACVDVGRDCDKATVPDESACDNSFVRGTFSGCVRGVSGLGYRREKDKGSGCLVPPMPLCRVFIVEPRQSSHHDGRNMVLVHATEPQQATGTVRWRQVAFQYPVPLQLQQEHNPHVRTQRTRTKLIFAVHDYGPLHAPTYYFIGQAEVEVTLSKLEGKKLDLQLPLRGGSAGSGARLHVQLGLQLRAQGAKSHETAAARSGTRKISTITPATHGANQEEFSAAKLLGTTSQQKADTQPLHSRPQGQKQLMLKSKPLQVAKALQCFRVRTAGLPVGSAGVSSVHSNSKKHRQRPRTAAPAPRLRTAILRVARAERQLQQHATCVGDAALCTSHNDIIQGPTRKRYIEARARAIELAAAGQHIPVESDSLSSVRAFIDKYNLAVDTAVHPATEGRTLRTRADLVNDVRALLAPETSTCAHVAAGTILSTDSAECEQMDSEADGNDDDLLDLDASPMTLPHHTRNHVVQYRFCTRCMRETEIIECGRSGLFQHTVLCAGHGGTYPKLAESSNPHK